MKKRTKENFGVMLRKRDCERMIKEEKGKGKSTEKGGQRRQKYYIRNRMAKSLQDL